MFGMVFFGKQYFGNPYFGPFHLGGITGHTSPVNSTRATGLKNYTPAEFPTLPDGEPRYISEELRKIKNITDLLLKSVKALDLTLVTNGM